MKTTDVFALLEAVDGYLASIEDQAKARDGAPRGVSRALRRTLTTIACEHRRALNLLDRSRGLMEDRNCECGNLTDAEYDHLVRVRKFLNLKED